MFQQNLFITLFFLLCGTQVFSKDYWRQVQDMTQQRMLHRSTFVTGMNIVVITGGCSAAIDVYFVSNSSIVHRGDMTTTRCDHSADLLPNGKIVIVGCSVFFNNPHVIRNNDNDNVADLYDPRSGTIEKTIPMISSRFRHTSSIIRANFSTKILIAGGYDGSAMATGDVYDAKHEYFYSVNNSMTNRREFHTATILPSGHVIIAGGCRNDGDCLDDLVLYNSRLNRFMTLDARFSSARAFHTATYIPSIESILFVCGGIFDLFDVPTLSFVANGTTLHNRQEHTATLLLDGRVLITGGIDNYGLSSCEIYDPLTNKFIQAANMSTGRYWHTATLIPTTGEVLVCGGRNLQGLFNSCEIYTP